MTRTWRLGIAPTKLKFILLRLKMLHCWRRLFFLNMFNTAAVTWCAYLVLITLTAFSKHISAANEFTIPASLSDSGHPDPNMRPPWVLHRAISIWSPPRSTTNRSFSRKSAKIDWFFFARYQLHTMPYHLWCCIFLMKETEPRAISSGRKWWFKHCYGRRLSMIDFGMEI